MCNPRHGKRDLMSLAPRTLHCKILLELPSKYYLTSFMKVRWSVKLLKIISKVLTQIFIKISWSAYFNIEMVAYQNKRECDLFDTRQNTQDRHLINYLSYLCLRWCVLRLIYDHSNEVLTV